MLSNLEESWCPFICLVQVWAPIKVKGSTFLSIADQPFILYKELDKRLSSYRRLCLDNYKEGPPARVLTTQMSEYNPDIRSYSAVEFPLRQSAIQLGIHSYCAFPLFHLHDHQCVGVFEFVSTQPLACLPWFISSFDFKSCDLHCIFDSKGTNFFDLQRYGVVALLIFCQNQTKRLCCTTNFVAYLIIFIAADPRQTWRNRGRVI